MLVTKWACQATSMMKRMAMRVSLLAPQKASTTNRRLLHSSLVASSFTDFQVSSVMGWLSFLYFGGGPPHGVLGVIVHDDILVLGGAAGVDTGHDVDGAQLADLALFIAFQAGLGFFREQLFVGRIVHDFGGAGDAILFQINVRHFLQPLFSKYSSLAAAQAVRGLYNWKRPIARMIAYSIINQPLTKINPFGEKKPFCHKFVAISALIPRVRRDFAFAFRLCGGGRRGSGESPSQRRRATNSP